MCDRGRWCAVRTTPGKPREPGYLAADSPPGSARYPPHGPGCLAARPAPAPWPPPHAPVLHLGPHRHFPRGEPAPPGARSLAQPNLARAAGGSGAATHGWPGGPAPGRFNLCHCDVPGAGRGRNEFPGQSPPGLPHPLSVPDRGLENPGRTVGLWAAQPRLRAIAQLLCPGHQCRPRRCPGA